MLALVSTPARAATFLTRLLGQSTYNGTATMPIAGDTGLVAAVDFDTPWGMSCTQPVADLVLRRPSGSNATAALLSWWLWSSSSAAGTTGRFNGSAAVAHGFINVTAAAMVPPTNTSTIPVPTIVWALRMPLAPLALPLTYGTYWLGVAAAPGEWRWPTTTVAVAGSGAPYRIVDAYGTARPSLPALMQWTPAADAEPALMPVAGEGVRASATQELALVLYANCTGGGMSASDARVLAALPLLTSVFTTTSVAAVTPSPTPALLPTPTPTPTPGVVPTPSPSPSADVSSSSSSSSPSPLPVDAPTPTPTPTPTPPPTAPLPVETPSPSPSLMDVPVPIATTLSDFTLVGWIVAVSALAILVFLLVVVLLYVWRRREEQRLRNLTAAEIVTYADDDGDDADADEDSGEALADLRPGGGAGGSGSDPDAHTSVDAISLEGGSSSSRPHW